MAIYRVIPAGDIDLGPDRRGVLLRGPEFVRTKLSQRLRFFLGEWFIDRRQGVPYFQDVFVKNPDLDVVRAIFRQVMVSIQEVSSIPMLDLTYDSGARRLAVSFDAHLVAGGVLQVRQPDPPFIIQLPS